MLTEQKVCVTVNASGHSEFWDNYYLFSGPAVELSLGEMDYRLTVDEAEQLSALLAEAAAIARREARA